MSKISFLMCLLSVGLVLACRSPNPNEILPSSPDLAQPVVTGLYITGATGPEIIDVWGNPSSGSINLSTDEDLFSKETVIKDNILFNIKNSTDVSPDHSVIPTKLVFLNPYPNPCAGSCMLNYNLPYSANVEIFIVPARLIGTKNSDISTSSGAVTVSPKRTAIAFLKIGKLSPGIYMCSWNNRFSDGSYIPGGFYRIYLRVEKTVLWHDIFLFTENCDVPPGLRRF